MFRFVEKAKRKKYYSDSYYKKTCERFEKEFNNFLTLNYYLKSTYK